MGLGHSLARLPKAGPLKLPPPPAGCLEPFYVDPSDRGRCVGELHRNAVKVSCGRCARCAMTRRNMLVGRMSAQAQSSQMAVMLTLTYGPPEDRHIPFFDNDGDYSPWPDGSRTLISDHIRAFRKAMTKSLETAWKRMNTERGFCEYPRNKPRLHYVMAGEYGAKRQRAHWHVILFFPLGMELPEWTKIPDGAARAYRHHVRNNPGSPFVFLGYELKPSSFKDELRFRVMNFPSWKYGHVDVAIANATGFRYVAKYLLKDSHRKHLDHKDMTRQTFGMWSRQLGVEYIRSLGVQHADQGLPPSSSVYRVAGDKFTRGPKAGSHVTYTMTRAMQREFVWSYLRAIATQLRRKKLAKWNCKTEFIMKWLDRDTERDPRCLAEALSVGLRGHELKREWWLPSIPTVVSYVPVLPDVKHPAGLMHVVTCKDRNRYLVAFHCKSYVAARRREGPFSALAFAYPLSEEQAQLAINKDATEALASIYAPDTEYGRITCEYSLNSRERLEVRRYSPTYWDEYNGKHEDVHLGVWQFATRVRRAEAAALHANLIEWIIRSWTPSAEVLGNSGVRSIGLPLYWEGAEVTPDLAERYPLFARWMREADVVIDL